MPGATVIVTDLSQRNTVGAATDLDGYFTVTGVPIGRHILKVSYIGYKTAYDTVDVNDTSEILNLALDEGGIGIIKIEIVQRIEDYQKYLARMKPEDVLEIRVDSVGADNYPFSKYAVYSTFYNRTDTPIYVIKDTLLIFNTKVIVMDSSGHSQSKNRGFIDYMGMQGILSSSDLLRIAPRDSIKYVSHTYYNGLEGYPPGKYRVTIRYEYKRASWLNKMYVNASPEVASYVYNMALRGKYKAMNYVVFDNKTVGRAAPER